MIDFLQKFLNAATTYPERIAVVDKDGARSTTYKKLDELSGRVASFLKGKGFQKEDRGIRRHEGGNCLCAAF